MQMLKRGDRSKARMVKFIEDNHQYIGLEDGSTDWLSVTSLIKKYEPKKDWDKIAARYAKKHGLSLIEVKQKWASENKRAIDKGVNLHRIREEDLLSCETVEIEGRMLPVCRPTINEEGHKVSPSQRLTEGVYPEILLFMPSAKVCGQADRVEISGGVINVKDWKTNKEIKMQGFVNWEGIEERMLSPISNISNSNYWHYALQLNTYAYIIRKNNPHLKLGRLELLHVQFDENGEETLVKPYTLPDLQGSVESMINHYKLNRK